MRLSPNHAGAVVSWVVLASSCSDPDSKGAGDVVIDASSSETDGSSSPVVDEPTARVGRTDADVTDAQRSGDDGGEAMDGSATPLEGGRADAAVDRDATPAPPGLNDAAGLPLGEPGCEGDATDCAGNAVVECVDGRWVTGERCAGSRPHCVQGACKECLLGEVSCDQQAALTCSADGSWVVDRLCSGETSFCLAGGCVECEPDRNWCVDRTPWVCRSDGSAREQAACGAGLRCDRGQCVADAPPVVEILEPLDGARIVLTEPVTWLRIPGRARAFDAVDGPIEETARVRWLSDRTDLQQVLLSYGVDVTLALYVPDTCEETVHVITVQVTDSAYNRGEASARVTIVPPC